MRRCALFYAMLTLSLALPPTGAEQRGDTPDLVLGTVAADPGTIATIPLYYTPGSGQAIHSLHLELEFVSNSVKFSRAEKGAASVTQDFDVKVDAQEVNADDRITKTRLTLDFSVPGADGKKSLPEGMLALLDFQVPTDAKPFSIALNPLVASGSDASDKPTKLSLEAGKIIVSVPDAPMVGCFFFTH